MLPGEAGGRLQGGERRVRPEKMGGPAGLRGMLGRNAAITGRADSEPAG